MRVCAALMALCLTACGLGVDGLASIDDGGPAINDATTDAPTRDAADDRSIIVDGGADADASPFDAPADAPADVRADAGCNVASDCPPPMACQQNHTCGTTCGTGQQTACNGGCCNVFTCVAWDNDHCGVVCGACGGGTPTCGVNGSCNGNCGNAGDGTCGTSCCNAGNCATIGNTTCGDFGAACASCAGSAAGPNCELIALHYTCGCDGPGNANQCPIGKSCHNQQCANECDGQHPCNGGCCSGNNLLTSTCVATCDGGMTCQGNYCQ